MILKQQSILVVFEEKHYQRLSIEGFIYLLQSIYCNLSFHAIDNHWRLFVSILPLLVAFGLWDGSIGLSEQSVVEYNPKDMSISTRRRISLWLQGSLFVLPRAAILFCGFPSANGRPDRWGGSSRQACLYGWTSRPDWKGVSPGKATNFLIYFFPNANPSYPSNPW